MNQNRHLLEAKLAAAASAHFFYIGGKYYGIRMCSRGNPKDDEHSHTHWKILVVWYDIQRTANRQQPSKKRMVNSHMLSPLEKKRVFIECPIRIQLDLVELRLPVI